MTEPPLTGWTGVSRSGVTWSFPVSDQPEEPYRRPTRWLRLRRQASSRWSSLRMRLGSWIAGTDLNERDDW